MSEDIIINTQIKFNHFCFTCGKTSTLTIIKFKKDIGTICSICKDMSPLPKNIEPNVRTQLGELKLSN